MLSEFLDFLNFTQFDVSSHQVNLHFEEFWHLLKQETFDSIALMFALYP